MNDTELDQLIAMTASVSDRAVRELPLDAADVDLMEAIMSTPRTVPAPPPSPSLRRIHRRVAVAAVATIVLLGGLVVVPRLGDSSSGTAWADELVEVAEAAPRILIIGNDWTVARADQMTGSNGEMTFAGDGRTVEVWWTTASNLDPLLDHRLADATDVGEHALVDQNATVVSSPGRITAVFGLSDHTIEVLADDVSGAEFVALLDRLTLVDIDTWLEAMPAEVVRPDGRAVVVDQMLADIPLPHSFDRTTVRAGDAIRDRYLLGAEVVGAVSCAWIDLWIGAIATGDAAAAGDALGAMESSRSWAVLVEMGDEGDDPDMVWQYAAAIAGDGTMLGGSDRTAVEESYSDALGCPQ